MINHLTQRFIPVNRVRQTAQQQQNQTAQEHPAAEPGDLYQPLFSGNLHLEHHAVGLPSSQAEAAALTVYREDSPLEQFKADLDHEAPRGKSRYPAWAEAAGETSAGIVMDLSKLAALPLLPLKGAAALGGLGYRKLERRLDQRTPQQRETAQREQHMRETQRVLNALTQQADLSDIRDEEGERIPPRQVKARVLAALRQEPKFLSVAQDALAHPIVAGAKWIAKAKPVPQAVVETLAKADFLEAAQEEASSSRHVALSESRLEKDEAAPSSSRALLAESRLMAGSPDQSESEVDPALRASSSKNSPLGQSREGEPSNRAQDPLKQKLRKAALTLQATEKFRKAGKQRRLQEQVVGKWQALTGEARAERVAQALREMRGYQPYDENSTAFERAVAGRFRDGLTIHGSRKLTLDAGPSERDAMERDMRISGSALTRLGHTVADWMRMRPSFQQREISQADFQEALEKSQLPPTKNPYKFMILNPGDTDETLTIRQAGWKESLKNRLIGSTSTPTAQATLSKMQVHSTDPNAKLLLAFLLKGQEANMPPIAPGTQVAVKVRNTESFKENVLEPLVNTFRITDKIQLKGGRQVQLKEGCMWPFLESVILHGDKELGPDCRLKGTEEKCFDRLANADVYKFESSDKRLEGFLNHRLHANEPEMKDLKARLAAIQAASLHYAEQVEIRETVESFLKGAIVGVTGEAIVENTLHPKEDQSLFKQPNFWANVALLGLVDAYDNWQGEQGALEADLKGMGLKNIPEHVFGEEAAHQNGQNPSFKDKVRQYAKLFWNGDAGGPAAQSVANAYRAAFLGATGGALASLGTAQPFSKKDSSIPELMGGTAGATLGTGLSIPINFAFTLPRVMAAYNEHLQAGRLKLPADVNPQDEQAVSNHVREVAIQEMMARVGLQASAKAYTVVPGLSLSWIPNIKDFVPRSVIQPLVFGFTPAMENLTRLGFAMQRLNNSFPETIRQTERMVLASKLSGEESSEQHRNDLRSSFNDLWSKTSAKVMDYSTYWPLQRTLTDRRHIDYVPAQPVGDENV